MNDSTTSTVDPTLIDTFANKVGAQPAVVMWYQNRERIGKRDFNPLTDKGTGMMDEVASRGAMPMVTWTPQDPALGINQPEYALWAIIAGDHDEYIAQWARDARAWAKPFYLRYAHEMNGRWQPWSPGVNGNTAAGADRSRTVRYRLCSLEKGAWDENPGYGDVPRVDDAGGLRRRRRRGDGPRGADQRAGGAGSERTFSGTVPEGVTVGRTTVDRPSPEERGRSEARLLECQIEEAEGDLGREGLGALVGEMVDELVERPDADFGQLLAERGYTCGRLVSP